MKRLALLAAAAVMAAFGAHAAVSSLSIEANAQFLADNAKKPGVMVRPSGLQYRIYCITASASAPGPTTS